MTGDRWPQADPSTACRRKPAVGAAGEAGDRHLTLLSSASGDQVIRGRLKTCDIWYVC